MQNGHINKVGRRSLLEPQQRQAKQHQILGVDQAKLVSLVNVRFS